MGNESYASAGRPDDGGPTPRAAEIGLTGITVPALPERLVDVHLDGRWIWSFRTERNAGGLGRGSVCSTAWPGALRAKLRGHTEVTVVDDGIEVGRQAMHFPGSDGRVEVSDRNGRPLVVGPHQKLIVAFGDDPDSTRPLIDAAHQVLAVMAEAGIRGFLAYGTLLGAVREGGFIGHDNDVDLGYVSDERHPVDVVAESLRLQHAFSRAGMQVERYSGAGLKIWVRDAAGVRRGLDVFGGFWRQGRLALLGEIYTPFERSWIEPLGEAMLVDSAFPVPARAEKLLEAMYGPHWRTPDPTFVFEPGTDARAQLNQWFRGIRHQRNTWDAFYAPHARTAPLRKPHHLARVLDDHEPGATVVDVGCGRGRDAVWLAEQGHRVLGLDYSAAAFRYLARGEATAAHLDVRFHAVNLLELQHVLAWGARIARIDGPRAMMARHVVDATTKRGRDGLWRLASMGLRGGGRLYLEFFGAQEQRPSDGDELVWEVDPEVITAEAVAHGGTVQKLWQPPMNAFEMPPGRPKGEPEPVAYRMVVEWT